MNKLSVILMLIGTLFAGTAQIIWKYGIGENNYLILISGYLFYGLFFVLMTLAFKHDKLSSVYPLISLSFLWVAIFGYWLFNETINLTYSFGLIAIIAGITLVGVCK